MMIKFFILTAAVYLRQAAGLCSSDAGFDLTKVYNYNAIVTGYKVNVQRIVGNGLVGYQSLCCKRSWKLPGNTDTNYYCLIFSG